MSQKKGRSDDGHGHDPLKANSLSVSIKNTYFSVAFKMSLLVGTFCLFSLWPLVQQCLRRDAHLPSTDSALFFFTPFYTRVWFKWFVRQHSSEMCQKLWTAERFTWKWRDSQRAFVTQPRLKAATFSAAAFCLHDLIHQINAINPRHLFLEHLLYAKCRLVVRRRDCTISLGCSEYWTQFDLGKRKSKQRDETDFVGALLLLNLHWVLLFFCS